ncbi:TetR/AcrR family transcriptional regulator, partial [Acinetobacter baumannii]|uniref:TetR/AcrR family transcriptional regulator n=1 Tax=Acinetobacter baumannii TaxID=470 RepID=UPI002ED8BF64
MIFNRGSAFIISYFLISLVNAGEIGAKLTSQIELLPSCSVNNNVLENNTANLNFGTIDFGEATTALKGVLEASLVNNGNSGFQIECAGIVFLTKGYSGFSMRGVATQSNISLSTLQHYFQNKDILLKALLNKLICDYIQRIEILINLNAN